MLKVNKPINLKVQVVYIHTFAYRPGVSLHVHTFTEILAWHYFVCCRSGNHRVNKDQIKFEHIKRNLGKSTPHVYHDCMLTNTKIHFSTHSRTGSSGTQTHATSREYQGRGSSKAHPWSSSREKVLMHTSVHVHCNQSASISDTTCT